MTIESNRMLGGIGAIFSLLGLISTISTVFLYGNASAVPATWLVALISGGVGLFVFVGFIMLLIAMYGFSNDYGDRRIFNYIIYGIVGTIIAAVVAGVALVIVLLLNYNHIFPSSNSIGSLPSSISPMVAVISLAGLVWIVFIVKAFNRLGNKSEVPLFKTAAFVLLAGAVLGLVLEIVFASLAYFGAVNYNSSLLAGVPGSLIQNFAWALFAIAFFRIKAPTATHPLTQPSIPLAAGQMKYCAHCGTPNQTDAIYCTHCGQTLA